MAMWAPPVQEIVAALDDKKVPIRDELAEPDPHMLLEHALLEPKLVQARRRGGLEIAHGHQAADVLGGNAVPVYLIAVGMKAEALPQAHLLHVTVEMEFEHTVVDGALLMRLSGSNLTLGARG